MKPFRVCLYQIQAHSGPTKNSECVQLMLIRSILQINLGICLKNPKKHIQFDTVMKDRVRHDMVIRWQFTVSVSINVYNLWRGPIVSTLYIDPIHCYGLYQDE